MGRKLFIWLLVLTVVLAGAGAAAGVVLSELIVGEVTVTVEQALQIEKPTVTKTTGAAWPNPYFTSVSADRTKFTAAVEAYTGDAFLVSLPIRNLGDSDLVTEFTLTVEPAGAPITIGIVGSGDINDVVRISATVWKFTVDAIADNGNPLTDPNFDGVKITVTLDKAAPPGFYKLAGQIKVVEY